MTVGPPPTFSSVSNEAIPGVVAGMARAVSTAQAQLYAGISDLVHRNPFVPHDTVAYLASPAEFGADDLRAECRWTRARAHGETDLAVWLTRKFPQLWSALHSGAIDLPKVRIFHSYLPQLPAASAQALCDELLPRAVGWTTSKLVGELRRRVLSRDPESARERYDQAIADRGAAWYLNDNGTASLILDGLAPDTAAAAKRRINHLATDLRRRGYPGTLPQIRADVIAALLDGTLEGLSRAGILDRLLEQAPTPEPETTHESGGQTASKATAQVEPTDQTEPAAPPERADQTQSADQSPPADQTQPAVRTDPADQVVQAAESAGQVESVSGSGAVAASVPWTEARGASAGVSSSRPGVDLHVQLATLLGENEQPGHSVDLRGPVLPHISRRVAATQRGGRWIFAVCDQRGYLVCSGITRRRPDHTLHRHQGGTLELRMTRAQLDRWRASPPPGWGKLVADIGRFVDRWPETLARINSEPGRRFPNAALRRHVQLRDQVCQGPAGCGTPARYCDWEHSVAHDRGGDTDSDNGRAQCRHDHLLKTRGRWKVRTLAGGELEWTSPLGRRYTSRPEPLMHDDDPPPF